MTESLKNIKVSLKHLRTTKKD